MCARLLHVVCMCLALEDGVEFLLVNTFPKRSFFTTTYASYIEISLSSFARFYDFLMAIL